MRTVLCIAALLSPLCAFAAEDNILRNAGFTQCAVPGQPDYWGTGAPRNVSNFYGNYHTHPNSPMKGTHSLMLRNREGQPGWTVQSHLYRGMNPEGDYTLSVYLRADRPDTRVTLGMGPATKEITVSAQWERYTWTAKPGKSSWGYTIRFSIPKGTLWIAAPIWVPGTEPADFALNPADAPKAETPGQPRTAKRVPAIAVSQFSRAEHTLDGELSDPFWSKAAALPPFVDLHTGGPAKLQTRAWLAATELALYIGLECLQPDMPNVRIAGERDGDAVYPGECVEVFIAPERTSGPYYHFAVNPDGVKAEEEGFDTSWGCEWAAHTRRFADRWTAQIAIMWSELPIGPQAGDVWGMNLCRHARAKIEEYSQWSNTESGFHNPARFGLVTLPGGLVGPRAMDLAWTGTWTRGDAWGLTLRITPGAANAGRRTVGAVVYRPGTSELPPPGSELETPVVFSPGKPLDVKLGPIAGNPGAGEYRAVVSVFAEDGRPPAQNRRLTRTILQPAATVGDTGAALRALVDRSYYTTETHARLRIWCTDPRAQTASAEVAGRTYSATLAPGPAARWAELTIPLADLPAGETAVSVTLAGPAESLPLVAGERIVKLEDKPYGVKVDRFSSTFIVDGKPFIPYCMGIHSIGQVDRLQDIKDHGFNTICGIFSGSSTEEELKANLPAFNRFFDECRRLGLKIIWWNAGGESYEKIRDGLLGNIAAFRDNDLILGWYILDEPEGWWESPTRKEADLPRFHEAVAQADPYRPSFFNYYSWKPGYGGYGGLVSSDVGSLDRYPIGRGDGMKAMDDITRTMAADCLPIGKPVNIWLQLYGYDDAVREATAAEQRCQSYLCLIAGARSLMYFIYKPMGRAMWNSMLPLGREIETLTPVLAATPPEQPVTADTDLVRFTHRYYDGRWYLICANRSTSKVKATFDLSSLKVMGLAQVAFSDKKVKVSGGKLIDTFPPLATKVYAIEGK